MFCGDTADEEVLQITTGRSVPMSLHHWPMGQAIHEEKPQGAKGGI